MWVDERGERSLNRQPPCAAKRRAQQHRRRRRRRRRRYDAFARRAVGCFSRSSSLLALRQLL